MRVLERLASLRLFFILMTLVLLACALGGVIPQKETIEKYHELFGHDWGTLILRFGLHDIFRSFWFLGLLALSGANLAACSLKRWKALKVRPGVFVSHMAVMLIFTGGIVRGLFSERGFLPLEVGETRTSFILEDGKSRPLSFAITLKDFNVHYWEEGKHRLHAVRSSDGFQEAFDVALGKETLFNPIGIVIQPVRFYPNFIITEKGPESRNEARENPALEIKVKEGGSWRRQFIFANFPDFHKENGHSPVRLLYEYIPGKIRQFESRLVVSHGGRETREATIEVNSPLNVDGYRFYQSGFDPKNPRFSAIQVSKDPSVPLIYSGFGLLLFGLGWAFVQHPGRV